jgi:hypothetical protein
MNRNLKIALGIIVGAGLVYLGYRLLYKKEDKNSVGASTDEPIVYEKSTRRVRLVEND